MAETRFETTVEAQDGGTFIEVPLDVRAVFGRVRAPVRATVNGHTYRSTVMRYGERYCVPLNRANREAAGVAAGDAVAVADVARPPIAARRSTSRCPARSPTSSCCSRSPGRRSATSRPRASSASCSARSAAPPCCRTATPPGGWWPQPPICAGVAAPAVG
jgi:hypothetical protein